MLKKTQNLQQLNGKTILPMGGPFILSRLKVLGLKLGQEQNLRHDTSTPGEQPERWREGTHSTQPHPSDDFPEGTQAAEVFFTSGGAGE